MTPTMTPQQIAAVRSSFAKLAPIAPQAAKMFYDNLFHADPAIARMFSGDMVEQGSKLMQMIGSAVALLDQPGKLMPVLHRLGERHSGYGVQSQQYYTVGSALLRTLAQGLGDDFDEDTCQAWCEFYALISGAMLAGAAVVIEREKSVAA